VLLGMSASSMAEHHYSFPVVTGIDPGDSVDARKSRMATYLRMMAELDADGKHFSEQISEIDLTDPEDARVLMPEQGTDILAHFGEDRFLQRFQRYQAHIAEWKQQYPHLASVDLRYDNQVVLQMASGKEAAQADAGGNATSSPSTPSPASSSAASNDPPKHSAGKAAKRGKPAAAGRNATSKRAALKTARSNAAKLSAAGRNPGSTSRTVNSGVESGQ
jgi:cell division protein FtsQ